MFCTFELKLVTFYSETTYKSFSQYVIHQRCKIRMPSLVLDNDDDVTCGFAQILIVCVKFIAPHYLKQMCVEVLSQPLKNFYK